MGTVSSVFLWAPKGASHWGVSSGYVFMLVNLSITKYCGCPSEFMLFLTTSVMQSCTSLHHFTFSLAQSHLNSAILKKYKQCCLHPSRRKPRTRKCSDACRPGPPQASILCYRTLLSPARVDVAQQRLPQHDLSALIFQLRPPRRPSSLLLNAGC